MIQVNFFRCGGIAISTSNSHKLIDGATYMSFLKAWASMAKFGSILVYPSHECSSIFPPNTDQNATNGKSILFPISSVIVRPSMLNHGKCAVRRFVFDSSAILALKAKATESGGSSSHVAAVTSFIWRCATIAARKQHGERRPSIMKVSVNIRSRFSPPLAQNTIGNIIWDAVVRCEADDEELRLDSMVEKWNSSVSEVNTSLVEGFKGEEGFLKVIEEANRLGNQLSSFEADYYASSSMCKSGPYEVDFGWGKPVWSCYANFIEDIPIFINGILLMDTRNGDGIEAWVMLSKEQMEILENDMDFLSYASLNPSPLHC